MMYNIVRIGPMYMNFMYAYVLCHKEAHAAGNLFVYRWLSCVFNYWVGLFHGVLPGTFTVSHIYNHHKYDNSDRDVYSTAFRPRNSFTAWLAYLAEWFGYASNLSSILAFFEEGKPHLAWRACRGTLWFLCFFLLSATVHLRFTLCTIGYAFVEGNILLCVVNWVWHAFIDPEDPSSDYVNSTTIVEGLNFTLNEEYHVVHHQYAGAHWSRYKELYERHAEGYLQAIPSAFYKVNIFELFAHIVSGNVKELVKLYYKPLQKIPDEELAALLLARLECHGPEIATMRRKGLSRKIRDHDEK
jgi:fatty acid desaturase